MTDRDSDDEDDSLLGLYYAVLERGGSWFETFDHTMDGYTIDGMSCEHPTLLCGICQRLLRNICP
jgi:hypothetical protein